jgi:hypothetical protein
MQPVARHQCLIYEGPPSQHLKAVAAVVREKLRENYRCLYLNSGPMVAGMRWHLAAAGVDVASETERGSLVLTSKATHLTEDDRFDVDWMMETLGIALDDALRKGFAGLWATGDMTWEFGPEKNFSKLLEYELRLEAFIRQHHELGGICQYHADTLPREAIRQSLLAHPSIFVNETLSLVNPHFLEPHFLEPHFPESHSLEHRAAPAGEANSSAVLPQQSNAELDTTIARVCQPQHGNGGVGARGRSAPRQAQRPREA